MVSKLFFTVFIVSLMPLVQTIWGSTYEDRELFRDDQAGFEVTYPKTWETNPLVKGKRFAIRNSDGNELGVISISIASLKGDLAEPSNYLNYCKNKLPEILVNNLNKRLGNGELVTTEETTLSGHKAFLITLLYEVTQPTGSILILSTQIHCPNDGRLYLLNFESPADTYEANWATFEKILTTFNFRK